MKCWKYICLLMVVCNMVSEVYAQNFGLTSPQDAASLPRSAVPVILPVRKPKVSAKTKLEPTGTNEWRITGGWELAEASKVVASGKSLFSSDLDTHEWYNAQVPGTVLTTLVEQGMYPDPYFGVNNLSIPDSLCRMDWWYRTTFSSPASSVDKLAWLVFDGINYKADVWLNGHLLGQIQGAFVQSKFNATSLLKASGANILAVHIYPPHNPGIPHEQSPTAGRGHNGGQLCLDGPTFISSEGWDWVPGIRDRNIGLWQDVKIRYTGAVTLGDPQVITDLPLPDTTTANIFIRTELINHLNKIQRVTLRGSLGGILLERPVELRPLEQKKIELSPTEYPQLTMKNPRLWWPNGYGRPELYRLNLSVTDVAGKESDQREVRFGVRELSYELTVNTPEDPEWRVEFVPTNAQKAHSPLFDNRNRKEAAEKVTVPTLKDGADKSFLIPVKDKEQSPYLVIKVNGKPVFCRGGNWGMDDAMKNCTREHLEPYFKLHKAAHFNMVRNWTGESTEEVFYNLCDEYGLLVWNDFWLSTEGYNLNVNDDQLFLQNVEAVIRRFRNHPSIAVWCPRNEGYAPESLEDKLAGLVVSEDGTRHYQPNSRYMNLRPSGPWHYFTDPAEYFRSNARGFNTELGTPSLPSATSVRKMMAPEDTWPISDVWYYHDLHFGQKEYCQAIDHLYGTSTNLDDFCRKAQMVNYDSHRAMFEAWNSRLWKNTTGLLLWMTHPAWPSMVWQVYSWDYETFGSYFGCQKACEPVHIQQNLHDGKVVVVNTSLQPLARAKAMFDIYDLSGKKLYTEFKPVVAGANHLTECFTPSVPENLPEVYLARVSLADENGKLISVNDYWKSKSKENGFQQLNKLPKAQLKYKIIADPSKNKVPVRLTNSSKNVAVAIKLNVKDRNTNQPVLPALFSDGYINLLPGETRTIWYDGMLSGTQEIVADGYNLDSLSVL